MHADPAAAMSVILATPGTFADIATTMEHLSAQSARSRLEIVIVAPSAAALAPEVARLQGFAGVRMVEVGPIRAIAAANYAGVLQATAPLVAFAETHAFPEPGWAEALIRAHQGPWAAVGPAMTNANPTSPVSCASFLLAYGRWLGAAAGPLDDLPGHNSSYKRARLLEYGSDLEAMLEAESALHWDLQAKGQRLYLEPAARTAHLNPSLFGSFAAEMLYAGRRFAATRARHWALPRRLLYAIAAPLIPLVRLRRILPQAGQARRGDGLARGTLGLVAIGLVLSACGEMLGYASGAGEASERLCDSELHRLRHVNARDRQAAGGAA